MTLPVFSPTEVRNIRATKRICSNCKAIGMVVVNEPSDFYLCGYVTKAVRCPLCNGIGLVDSITVTDQKTAAAGVEVGR